MTPETAIVTNVPAGIALPRTPTMREDWFPVETTVAPLIPEEPPTTLKGEGGLAMLNPFITNVRFEFTAMRTVALNENSTTPASEPLKDWSEVTFILDRHTGVACPQIKLELHVLVVGPLNTKPGLQMKLAVLGKV